MPVRKVSNRGGNIIGKFPSIKMGRMIAFESLIERDFIYLLDYEKEVKKFEEQPLTIEYKDRGKILHYTPDFHLIETGRDVLVECKPEDFVNNDDNQRKFAAAEDWCEQHGWEYRVVTDRQIRNNFRLQNIKLLTRYAREAITPAMREGIYMVVSRSQDPPTIDSIAQTVSPLNLSLAVESILHMVFHHEIYLPLEEAPISGQMPVYLTMRTGEEKKYE